MTRKSDWWRLRECYLCEYFDWCWDEIPNPQEYPDGSCKQKDVFREEEERIQNENHI